MQGTGGGMSDERMYAKCHTENYFVNRLTKRHKGSIIWV